MDHLHARTLPRLLLDTVHCLLVAHDHVDHGLRSQTRETITSLRNADMTDFDRATSALRDATSHLRNVEASLNATAHPFAAKKIRDVRERVLFVTGAVSATQMH
jgi:hypothetical protein